MALIICEAGQGGLWKFTIMIRLCLLTLVSLVAGCTALHVAKPSRIATGPFALPEAWAEAGQGHDGAIATGWLSRFDDPDMQKLVGEAMAYNQDLRIAAARLRQAREGTIIARGARLPSISASTSGSRSGSRFREFDGDLSAWEQSTDYGLSLNASWELDLWGRLRDLHEASLHDYIAARADFRGARLSLAANTAKAWFNLITAGQLVESAIETRDMFLRDFRMKEGDFKQGAQGSALEVKFGRNNVASAERSLLNRRLAQQDAARALEVLIGRYPGAAIDARETLPPLPGRVPVGLPSELLTRRPDLVAATADLLASAAAADAARKNLLPSIGLSGRGSTSSDQLVDLIANPQSIAWNVAASLTQTVFRGGALTAQARQALQRNEAAINSYVAVALQAFQEVESALANERSLAEQEVYLETELEQANSAEEQAERELFAGLVTPLQLLEAQRRVISARNAYIGLRNQRLLNRIDLHLALGGDFETSPPELPEAHAGRS